MLASTARLAELLEVEKHLFSKNAQVSWPVINPVSDGIFDMRLYMMTADGRCDVKFHLWRIRGHGITQIINEHEKSYGFGNWQQLSEPVVFGSPYLEKS